jgi:hypothetical protein
MVAAGTHPTPTRHPRAREERGRARKSAAGGPVTVLPEGVRRVRRAGV